MHPEWHFRQVTAQCRDSLAWRTCRYQHDMSRARAYFLRELQLTEFEVITAVKTLKIYTTTYSFRSNLDVSGSQNLGTGRPVQRRLHLCRISFCKWIKRHTLARRRWTTAWIDSAYFCCKNNSNNSQCQRQQTWSRAPLHGAATWRIQ